MAKMKVKDFIAKAIEVEKVPTLYGWGKYMNKKDGKYLLCDCSGLIKGILWGYPSNGKYANNGIADWNANTMISKCSNVSTNFNKLPVGALVWMDGHIGIHVGNGVCVESSPKWENGIQCTFIRGSRYSNTRNLKERLWTKQGLYDVYVDYTDVSVPTPTPPSNPSVKDEWVAELQRELNKQYGAGLIVDGIDGPKTKAACPTVYKGARGGITKLIQKRLNSVGFHIAEDGIYGKDTFNSVEVFQNNRGITKDGIVGKDTWPYLLSGKKY